MKEKLVIAFNQGNPNPDMFQVYIDYTEHIFQILEFDVKMVPVVTGMRNGPAYERADLDILMKDIGSEVVSELEC